MTLAEAIEQLADHAEGTLWEYEDVGHDVNTCRGCGWSTDTDRKAGGPNFDHKPGCELVEAIRIVQEHIEAAT
jgi:hypothetical protein